MIHQGPLDPRMGMESRCKKNNILQFFLKLSFPFVYLLIHREGNFPGDSKQITYRELLSEVCKFANVLKDKGDIFVKLWWLSTLQICLDILKKAQTIKNDSNNEVMEIWISHIWTAGWRNNVEKIITVKYATYRIQLQKDSLKRFRLRLVRNQTLTSAILVQRSNQLS